MMSQSVQRNEGADAEMVEEYLAISRLQDMGLNQSDVKKLEDAGYKSVGMVMAQIIQYCNRRQIQKQQKFLSMIL